uniref:Flotillin1like [Acyrthosiphon pisum] n=1 Tax=Lepeophtheirus salmonis TaxID=72036 RepID=A0A0K2V0F4_LEPSM
MACIQLLRPEPGEAIVWASPTGCTVLRYGRDEPRWTMFPSIFTIPTSVISTEVVTSFGLTNEAISTSLVGSLRYSIFSETDSMLIDVAERFWSKGREGLHEMILDMTSSIQGSVLGEFPILQMRTVEGMSQFVAKIKVILERELDPLGISIQGYFVKELQDHVGYLNAIDSLQVSSIVKKSRISTAEKKLENVLTETNFKMHAFERSLQEKQVSFMETSYPELGKLKALIIKEIYKANEHYNQKLREVENEKSNIQEQGSLEISHLKQRVDDELDNYIEKCKKELEEVVYRPADEEKKKMEYDSHLLAEESIEEARKEARYIVLESERKAVKIYKETNQSLERLCELAKELKDYPLEEFINALDNSVEENGILKPFIELIVKLLRDFDGRNKAKTIKDNVPKIEEENGSLLLLSPSDCKVLQEPILPEPVCVTIA